MKIQGLSIAERILLAEEIWDSVAAEQGLVPITEEQRKELDQRLKSHEVSSMPGIPWEEVLRKLKAGI